MTSYAIWACVKQLKDARAEKSCAETLHDCVLKVIYHPLCGYHVTLSEGHMIANHPI